MLGIQVRPVTVEVLAYFLYLIPMVIFVLKSPRPRLRAAPGSRAAGEVERRSGGSVPTPRAGVSKLVAAVAFSACGSSGSNVASGGISKAAARSTSRW